MKKIFVRLAAGVIVSATLLGTIGCANTPDETTTPTTVSTTALSTTAETTTAATTPAETTTEIETSLTEATTPVETTMETTTKRDLSGVQEQYTELTLHFTSADVYASAQNGAVAEGPLPHLQGICPPILWISPHITAFLMSLRLLVRLLLLFSLTRIRRIFPLSAQKRIPTLL